MDEIWTPAELLEHYPQLPSMNTLLRLLNEGQIPAVRLGRKWFISRRSFEAWLANSGTREPAAV